MMRMEAYPATDKNFYPGSRLKETIALPPRRGFCAARRKRPTSI